MARMYAIPIANPSSVKYATYGDSVFVVEPKKVEPKKVELKKVEPKTAEQESDIEAAADNAVSESITSNESELAQEVDQQASEEKLVVRQQFVRLGEARGDYVVVTKGLSENEMVVNAGVFKLRNGAPVVINNDVVPEFSLNPVLKDQ